MVKQITVDDFKKKFLEGENIEIIDVRQPQEFNQIKIKGSKLIPMQELGSSLDKIDWTKQVIFVCRTGSRSGYIAQVLEQNGFSTNNLAGGIYMLSMNCQECIEQGSLDSTYFG